MGGDREKNFFVFLFQNNYFREHWFLELAG